MYKSAYIALIQPDNLKSLVVSFIKDLLHNMFGFLCVQHVYKKSWTYGTRNCNLLHF